MEDRSSTRGAGVMKEKHKSKLDWRRPLVSVATLTLVGVLVLGNYTLDSAGAAWAEGTQTESGTVQLTENGSQASSNLDKAAAEAITDATGVETSAEDLAPKKAPPKPEKAPKKGWSLNPLNWF